MKTEFHSKKRAKLIIEQRLRGIKTRFDMKRRKCTKKVDRFTIQKENNDEAKNKRSSFLV